MEVHFAARVEDGKTLRKIFCCCCIDFFSFFKQTQQVVYSISILHSDIPMCRIFRIFYRRLMSYHISICQKHTSQDASMKFSRFIKSSSRVVSSSIFFLPMIPDWKIEFDFLQSIDTCKASSTRFHMQTHDVTMMVVNIYQTSSLFNHYMRLNQHSRHVYLHNLLVTGEKCLNELSCVSLTHWEIRFVLW